MNERTAELRDSEETIKESLHEKEVLVKAIHHRVKNNMQVISSQVSLQADGSDNETAREVLRDVTYRVRSVALVHEKLYPSQDLASIDFAEYARSLLNFLWRPGLRSEIRSKGKSFYMTDYLEKHLTLLMCLALILTVCFTLPACDRTGQQYAVPPEKTTVALAATPGSALAQIALARGFFHEKGLDVAVHWHQYGKLALGEVLEGKADFATVAETPVMFSILNKEKISVIATIQTTRTDNVIIARRDKGISDFGDLRGKRIGATRGTTSDFFLYSFLVTRGISEKNVEVIDLKADDMPGALARGDMDAISTFSPFSAQTLRMLGKKAVVFRDPDIYRSSFLIVAKQELIRKNPEKVRKVLSALLKAEDFVRNNPAEAQKTAADFAKLPMDQVREVWAGSNFSVTLDQTLILALEDEADWAMKNGLTSAKIIPNYLNHIYIDGLKSLRPGSVKILR